MAGKEYFSAGDREKAAAPFEKALAEAVAKWEALPEEEKSRILEEKRQKEKDRELRLAQFSNSWTRAMRESGFDV